jgi:hypothetical protein
LTSTQAAGASPARTAMDDCVLPRARRVPPRNPAQLRQLQFHCGKPPPAAEPSTRIFIRGIGGGACAATATHAPRAACQRWAMYIVISMPKRRSIACGVSHFISISSGRLPWKPGRMARRAHRREARRLRTADLHDSLLMIFMSRKSRRYC